MEKLILKDNTEIEIEPGTGISRIIAYVEDYAALGDLAEKLTRENLSAVKIGAEGNIGSGSYTDMALGDPNFKITDMRGRLKVMFGLRQLTAEEIQRPLVETAIAYLTDEQALTVKALHPAWESLIEQTVNPGTRFAYGEDLYKVITPDPLLIQPQWIPGQGTSAIYSQIAESQAGTLEDPIDVPEDVTSNAFTYVVGKHYRWDGEPDGTEHSFVYSPDQLIDQYFTEVQDED